MRGLAVQLGVPVMTIYNYVPNKRALFDLITDHLLRPIEVPPPAAGSWGVRMRLLQRATRAAVARHTGVRLISGVGQSTEAARLADGALAILADGGFGPADANVAFSTLFTFMLGQLEIDAAAGSLADPGDGLGPFNSSSTQRDEVFEFAFDVLIDGLEARLHPTRSEPPHQSYDV
jgi:AcrR family transcriptional regulator